jgi:hypothetical protein
MAPPAWSRIGGIWTGAGSGIWTGAGSGIRTGPAGDDRQQRRVKPAYENSDKLAIARVRPMHVLDHQRAWPTAQPEQVVAEKIRDTVREPPGS